MSELVDITVPSPGESISSVFIAEIKCQPGDGVKAGDTLFEVDSDKATLDLPSPLEGIIDSILVEEGDEVVVGSVVAKIKPCKVATKTSGESTEGTADVVDARANQTGPAARVEADRLNVELDNVSGTGNKGRVLSKDVRAAVGGTASASVEIALPPTPKGREERVKMTPLRRTIARRLVEAQQTAAMLTTFNEADMTGIKTMRKRYQDQFVKKNGIKIGFMSFFIKASIEALKEYPAVNASIDGDSIVYKHYYNIGVAVSTKRGLVVPVLNDVDKLSFSGVEQALSNVAGKARDGKLKIQDFQNGTFTISNGGVFGSLMSTPILNSPQVGILGMHTIQDRPVNVNGEVVIRPMMYLALSYDHRIIDGSVAVQFLKRIKECVENPERILLEV